MSDFKVPSGLLARSKELLGLATKLGIQEVGYQVSKIAAANPQLKKLSKQLDQATALAETLSRLKGAAMKAGQLLSLDTSDLIPPEVRQILASLQSESSHTMSIEQVREILKQEVGDINFAKINNLSEKPFASASIGQVHRAEYAGQEIAIKIQYPGVSESVDSDLSIIKKIAAAFLVITRKSEISIDALFEELRTELHKEVDYRNEARNLEAFAEIVKPFPSYRVPSLVPDLSTNKVLSMSLEAGLSYQAWTASKPSHEERYYFGDQILGLYCLEFFENCKVQTDPNFANFLFDQNKQQLVLLDFGAVRSYSPDFVRSYITLMNHAHNRDAQKCVEQGIAMNFLHADERTETKLAFYDMIRASMSAFDDKRQPLYFGDKDYANLTGEAGKRFVQLIEFSPPPNELVFLHRKLGGIFSLLKSMDLTLDLRPYWNRVQESPHAPH